MLTRHMTAAVRQTSSLCREVRQERIAQELANMMIHDGRAACVLNSSTITRTFAPHE